MLFEDYLSSSSINLSFAPKTSSTNEGLSFGNI